MNDTGEQNDVEGDIYDMEMYLQFVVGIQIIFLIMLGIIGFLGNLLTIIAIVRTNKLRITANYFLVNLAVADIFVCVIIEPFYLLALFHRSWPLSEKFCALIAGISCVALSASVLNLLAIAVNRYFCIVQNKRYTEIYSNQRTVLYCVAVWVLALVSISPTFAGLAEFGFNKHLLICAYEISPESWTCQIASMAVIFAVSTFTFFFCYYQICKKASISSIRTKSRKGSTTSQVNFVGSNKTLGRLQKHLSMTRINPQKREIQVAKTSFIVLVTFIICWSPTVIQVAFDKNFSTPDWVLQTFAFLALANSSVNPFIYAWRNRHFRNAYKRIITCRHFFGNPIDDISSNSKNNNSVTQI